MNQEQETYLVRSMKANAVRGICAKYGVKIKTLDIENCLCDFDIDYFESHHAQFLGEIEKVLSTEE